MSEDVTQFRRHLNEHKIRAQQNNYADEVRVGRTMAGKENVDVCRKDVLSIQNTDKKNVHTKCQDNPSKLADVEVLNSTKSTTTSSQASHPKSAKSISAISPNSQKKASKALNNSSSDDPTAPVYPPRSPTTDIIPNELPIRHCYPNSTLAKDTDKPIQQVDGSIFSNYLLQKL